MTMNDQTESQEIKLIENLISHHLSALELVKDCETKLIHKELRGICKRIEKSYDKEISELRKYLKKWYEKDYEGETAKRYQRILKELRPLKGQDFEMIFMEQLAEDHLEILNMLENDCKINFHKELLELCRNMHEEEDRESQQLEAWLANWYRIYPQ